MHPLVKFARAAVLAAAIVAAPAHIRAQLCATGWSTAFAAPGVDGTPWALATFDDGTGPALFLGASGPNGGAGSNSALLARWNGVSWSNHLWFGTPSVIALAVWDDGNGPALYGGFETWIPGGGFVGRWNGSSWSALGAGVNGSVTALGVFDDGSGASLYAGGAFTTAGGVAASHLARWNGTAWSNVGGGVSGGSYIGFLVPWNDGTGPALYVGGSFTSAGGVPAFCVARWNGASWSALGTGLSGFGIVTFASDAAVFDDGGGPQLYVTGSFPSAGGASAVSIARWSGAAWSSLGAGLGPFGVGYALQVWNDGSGTALHVAGSFALPGVPGGSNVARWKASGWSALGGGVGGTARALEVHDDGTGPLLHVCGSFATAGSAAAAGIARWNGSAWHAMPAHGLNGAVTAMGEADLGDGAALFAGGAFTTAGGTAAAGIARWRDSQWSALGTGIPSGGTVRAIASYDGGSGPALYVGGTFASAGGVAATNVSRWNGVSWSALGSGLSASGGPGAVRALAVFDDGGGPLLFAGGDFSSTGGAPLYAIATWNGASWSAAGGVPGAIVTSLLVGDVGSGPELFAGGEIAGTAYGFVARRSGSSWQVLGTTEGPPPNPFGFPPTGGAVKALAAFDDGNGPALWAGGAFFSVNGVPAARVAKWNGAWSAAAGATVVGTADALVVFDDGSGPALHVHGSPFEWPSPPINPTNLARLSGGIWTTVGGDTGITNGPDSSLVVHDDGTGPALYVGGAFTSVATDAGAPGGPLASSRLAKWGRRRPTIEMTQPGGAGTGVFGRNAWLLQSHEYYNVFSSLPCGAVGSGPYLGLCTSDPSLLVFQFLLPVGTVPFHFVAPVGSISFGGCGLPPGVVLDAVCFDWTSGTLGCVSSVARITVQ